MWENKVRNTPWSLLSPFIVHRHTRHSSKHNRSKEIESNVSSAGSLFLTDYFCAPLSINKKLSLYQQNRCFISLDQSYTKQESSQAPERGLLSNNSSKLTISKMCIYSTPTDLVNIFQLNKSVRNAEGKLITGANIDTRNMIVVSHLSKGNWNERPMCYIHLFHSQESPRCKMIPWLLLSYVILDKKLYRQDV